MGDNESSPDIDNLCSCFDQAFKLINDLDGSDLPTNDVNFQKKVNESIKLLERSTEMVNQLNLFSNNEAIEDVPNSSIKYLLLPVLLGYLHTKLTGKNRMECLRISDIYFKDYLKRIKSYEVCPIDIDLDELEDGGDNENENNSERAIEKINIDRKGMSSIADLQALGKERQAKIENFRRLKEAQEKLETLEGLLDKDETTDEQKREYYILLIKKWVSSAIEEIHGIKKEKEILKMIGPQDRKKLESADKIKAEPLKPFIITRTELQKQVFGLGYPSVPTMSIEAFIESKIQEGSLSETKPGQSNSLMSWAQNPDLKKQQDEDDAAAKEKADDEEDLDALRKARGWDEFKDDNKRGWGNRYNRS